MSNSQLKQTYQDETVSSDQVDVQNEKRAQNAWQTIKRIGTYLLEDKWKLILVITMVFISSGTGLLGPYLIGMAIDDFIVTKQSVGLLTLMIWLVFIFIGHSTAIFLQNYWMIGIAQNTVFTLRKQIFEQFHQLPIRFYDKRQQGELMSRVTNDIDNINNTLNESVIQIFSSIVTIIGTFTVMLCLSPLLTVITMSIVTLLLIGMCWLLKRTSS